MKQYEFASETFNFKIQRLDEDNFENTAYSNTNGDIHVKKIKRFSNIYNEDIAEQFKNMQDNIMNKEIPILSKLLAETSFDVGYESIAEKYFD